MGDIIGVCITGVMRELVVDISLWRVYVGFIFCFMHF